ncbi:MAG: hypothetical protein ABI890_14775 [Lapillicoccus sp.]
MNMQHSRTQGRTHRRPTTVQGWLTGTVSLGAFLLLGGCGGAVAPGLPAYTGSSSGTLVATADPRTIGTGTRVAPAPLAPPSVEATARTAADLPVTVRHVPLPAGLGAEQTRVAQRYGAFYDALAAASAAPEKGYPEVATVAVGTARQTVESFAAAAAAKQWRYVGVLDLTITSVTVAGAAATACGYYVDHSFPVDQAGGAAESVDDAPTYVRGRLTKTGNVWMVTTNANGVSCT